jgi:hypothetical protein
MKKVFTVALLLALAGCSGLPPTGHFVSACDAGEATYACQVERYNNISQ